MGKAILTIVKGPNEGDTVSIDWGVCRLLGRHLSESETALIDRDGNRILDGQSAQLIGEHLQDRAPAMSSTNRSKPSPTAFERGPDIVLADSSTSRAHALLFCDGQSVGVLDLGSTNGSYVNNRPVSSGALGDGDLLKVGTTEFQLKIDG